MPDKEGLYIPDKGAGTVWNVMPDVKRTLVTHVLAKLPLVRAVLAGSHAEIVCFHVSMERRRNRYDATFWRGDSVSGYALEDGASLMTHSTLSEICGAMVPLVRDLSFRWPEKARPLVLGLATDGDRVLFSAEHPSCKGTAWMRQHLLGRSPASIICDEGHKGVLSKICP